MCLLFVAGGSIMTQNTLFNFITEDNQFKRPFTRGGVHLVRAENKQGRVYYRFDLPRDRQMGVFNEQVNYQLHEHHISVDQVENTANAALSQYHYSAYFKTPSGEEYLLHVYFNHNDEPTKSPVFSVKNPSNEYEPIADTRFDQHFIDLAISAAAQVIHPLRRRMVCKIETLTVDYKRIEAEACELSKTVESNYPAYLDKLDELCKTIQQLMLLVNHSHYQKLYAFTRHMQAAFKEQYENSQVFHSTDVANDLDDTTSSVGLSTSSDISLPKSISVVEIPPLEIVDSKINDLINCFNTAANSEDMIRVYKDLHQVTLLLEEKRVVATLPALKKMRNLHHDIHHAIEQSFPIALLKGDFERLKLQLPMFNYLLTSNYLDLALLTKRHELLDFLLTHGDFAVNTHPITIKAKDYPSAVHYCFEHNLADCLIVLIKHNASLMLKNENDLPIAHVILSTPDHPLHKAMHAPDARAKTIGSQQFYCQLIAALHRYLRQHPEDGAQRATIEDAITSYNFDKENLAQLQSIPGSKILIRKRDELGELLSKKLMIERLKRDPEYHAHYLENQRAYNAYLRTMTPLERIQATRLDKCKLEEVTNLLNSLSIEIPFEVIKQSAIKAIRTSTLSFEKRRELRELQKIIGQPVGKPSKGKRKLIAQEEKLMAEINELIKEDSATQLMRDRQPVDTSPGIAAVIQRFSALLSKKTDAEINELTHADNAPQLMRDEQPVDASPGVAAVIQLFSALLSKKTDIEGGAEIANSPGCKIS